MRIALYNLTTTLKVGGVESFVWDLSRELALRGHEVTVIGGVSSGVAELAERRATIPLSIPNIRTITFPFISRQFWQSFPPLRRAYAEAKLLERLSFALPALPELIHGCYDIIHIQKPYDMAPALLARLLGGGKVVLGCHGEDFYRGDAFLARFVDEAVSCSRFNAHTVAKRYPIVPRVVFNGYDRELFCVGEADPALRSHYAPPSGDVDHLLLYVGRLMVWKGVDTAIEALTHIPRTALLIAGEGEDRPRLERIAKQQNVQERVHFLGTVPRHDLPRFYRTVDLLVATSYASETFGISLVEAQACGLPVVATQFGGFAEVVEDGKTGVLIPPRRPDALAKAVTTLLHAPTQRATMATAAPQWAEQFLWPAVVDRIEAAYQAAFANGNE